MGSVFSRIVGAVGAKLGFLFLAAVELKQSFQRKYMVPYV